MCGIVGYVGAKECTAILVNSLTKLEYRGYDSAGIAVFEGDRIKTVKAKGKLKDGLIEKLSHEPHFTATAGIGHTRWARRTQRHQLPPYRKRQSIHCS